LQGERPMAGDNKTLGRFILDGIPPAPRGIPQIEVTFDIDANGILKVTALDKATNRSQHITITASSGLKEQEIEQMKKDAELHKEEDEKRKALIEARNHADNVIYTAEKLLRENEGKVPVDLKTKTEDGVRSLRDLMNADDVDAIRKATEDLGNVIQQIGASMYQTEQANPAAGEPQSPPPDDNQPRDEGDDVVEGEFKNE
ncbi:MAG: Hsp70 family protein, partial [Anaerolineaceae bacterium]